MLYEITIIIIIFIIIIIIILILWSLLYKKNWLAQLPGLIFSNTM